MAWLPPRRRPLLVNFFRNFEAICRKDQQVETLRSYARANGLGEEELCPLSFAFWPADGKRRERVWILKPGDGGKGQKIVVMDRWDHIVAFLRDLVRSYPAHTRRAVGPHPVIPRQPRSSPPWVVQKYLENPLLLPGGRKFDMRLWVLLTHDLRVLVYRQGVLRTGCTAFSLDDLGDAFTHLSNHCIQAQHPEYGAYEPTNEMFFAEFDAWLRSLYGAPTLDGTILPQLRSLIDHAMRAAAPALRRGEGARHAAFQLFGFDFMVDADLRAHLIEVNSSPAAASQLLPALTEDLIAAAIDPLFPPPTTAAADDASDPEPSERDATRGATHTAAPLSPAARIAKAVESFLPTRRGRSSPQRSQAHAPSASGGEKGATGPSGNERAEGEVGEFAGQDFPLPPPPPAYCAAEDLPGGAEGPGSAVDEVVLQIGADAPATPATPASPREAGGAGEQVEAGDRGSAASLLDALPAPRKGPSEEEVAAIQAVWFCGREQDAIPADWASRDWSWHIMARRGFKVVADLGSP